MSYIGFQAHVQTSFPGLSQARLYASRLQPTASSYALARCQRGCRPGADRAAGIFALTLPVASRRLARLAGPKAYSIIIVRRTRPDPQYRVSGGL